MGARLPVPGFLPPVPGPESAGPITLQFFQYDPNNIIFTGIIWNPTMWPRVVSAADSQAYANAATQLGKYPFEYARIGGTDTRLPGWRMPSWRP